MIQLYIYLKKIFSKWIALKIMLYRDTEKIMLTAAKTGAEWLLRIGREYVFSIRLEIKIFKTLTINSNKHLVWNLNFNPSQKSLFKGGYYEEFFGNFKPEIWGPTYRYIYDNLDKFYEKEGLSGITRLSNILKKDGKLLEFIFYCNTGIRYGNPVDKYNYVFGPKHFYPKRKKLIHNNCIKNNNSLVFPELKNYSTADAIRAAAYYNRPNFVNFIKCTDLEAYVSYLEFPDSIIWAEWLEKFSKIGNMNIYTAINNEDLLEIYYYLKNNIDLVQEVYLIAEEYNSVTEMINMYFQDNLIT